MGYKIYIIEFIRNKTDWLASRNLYMKSRAYNVLLCGYKPEIDVFYYDSCEANRYQELVGELCWVVEIIQIDICFEVSILLSFYTEPRVVHI